jgi:hypothetical protein
MDLQAVKTSLDKWIKSLQETLAHMRNDLHDEFGHMLQVDAEITKAEIRLNQERMEA